MSNSDELDDLFKRNLEDPAEPAAYQEQDWDALEQMLDKPKKKRAIVYWIPALTGAAALLLLFFGWWMLRQPQTEQKSDHSSIANVVKEQPKTGKVATTGPKQQQPAQITKPSGTESFATNTTNSAKAVVSLYQSYQLKRCRLRIPARVLCQLTQVINKVSPEISKQAIAETNSPASNKPQTNELIASNAPAKPDTGTVSKPQKKAIKTQVKQSYRPQFALSVLALPDLNGVGGFQQQSKLGTNVGMLFFCGHIKKTDH